MVIFLNNYDKALFHTHRVHKIILYVQLLFISGMPNTWPSGQLIFWWPLATNSIGQIKKKIIKSQLY